MMINPCHLHFAAGFGKEAVTFDQEKGEGLEIRSAQALTLPPAGFEAGVRADVTVHVHRKVASHLRAADVGIEIGQAEKEPSAERREDFGSIQRKEIDAGNAIVQDISANV